MALVGVATSKFTYRSRTLANEAYASLVRVLAVFPNVTVRLRERTITVEVG